MLVGRWEMTHYKLGSNEAPGDGSYLEFDACSEGVCKGASFMADNGTTGGFTWHLDGGGTKITIDDPSPDGGYYNNTFEILELSDSKLQIATAKSPAGLAVFEMEKVP